MARKPAVKKFKPKPGYLCVGFDVSMSSIAGAAIQYDPVLDKMRGPALVEKRWQSSDPYYERLKDASRSHEYVFDLMNQLKGYIKDTNDIHIAVEEAWPFGIVKKAESAWLLQQAEMTGAFVSGLLRWGYENVYRVNVKTWRATVAADLGVKQNRDFDKWTVRQWAIDAFGVPEFPDLINSKKGKIPKPPTSKAKAVQPDDRYDSLGILAWAMNMVEEQLA